MEYDVVIGLEVHLEINTRTKMFSDAPYYFGADPNTCVSETDLALPGTLPCLNREAVRKALSLCLALDMDIDTVLRFDRKNYYYTDLPKGYQITQYFHPLGRNGHLKICINGKEKTIGIESIHLEEDTAKQIHNSRETLIDYNRCGLPLLEIVSEPVICSSEEAVLYLEKLKQIFEYLGISKARMEEGELRCDVNISLKEAVSPDLGNKVEVKNLNSLANTRTAIDHEIVRQKELLDRGEEILKETRRFDEKTRTTISMRKKEEIADYRYFREPNIFPIRISDDMMEDVRKSLPELPDVRYRRYTKEYRLTDQAARSILADKDLSDYYDKAARESTDPKILCNLLLSELGGLLAKADIRIEECSVKPEDLAELADILSRKELSSKQAKEVLSEMFSSSESPEIVINRKGFRPIKDSDMLLAVINEVLSENSQSVEDYKKGKDRALNHLTGQVMKKTKGQADPEITAVLLTNELAKR
ncbi:MAG: Asp-tRNA(Asn)/Glu-tRNA(Gln) amidotransferase subunit GatB [Erysipelotrichaceae bacterium]|nr:Asp-tRNA(Asn)/Glu-tRNA(Gln) amidotransferase subunit GatB [Erysipelotrichaceae bacterium]